MDNDNVTTTMARVNFLRVPTSLKDRKSWVVWKTINRNGNLTKIPFQINGQEAKSNDPSTWNTFDAVHEHETDYDGIGYVFSESDPFVGIDLDGCRNPDTGVVSEWAKKIIKSFATYAEVSPSLTGVKLFGIGKSPFTSGKKKELTDQPKCSNKTPAVEVYDKLRYFAVTGMKLLGMPDDPADCSSALQEFCKQHWKQAAWPSGASSHIYGSQDEIMDRACKYIARMPNAISGSGGHNATFHVACVLVLGFGLSPEQAYPIMCEYNTRCDPQWTEREIWHKLNSANSQPGQRNYLRDARPEQFNSIKIPTYRWIHQAETRITTLKEASTNYLDVLKRDGRTFVEVGIPEVEYAIGGGLEFGEMVVIGARPGHGKSAFALQALHTASLCGYKCAMISEEMSALVLGKRSIQYASDVPEEHWRTRSESVREHLEMHFAVREDVHIIESCGSADKAAEEIEKLVRQHGIKIVAVDYMQLLRGRGNTRYEQITNTSIVLRQLANSHKLILLSLCQLNRDLEKRDKFIPKMQDLRDSGQLEQDADVIMFLAWPYRLDENKDPHEYYVFIAKNRSRNTNARAIKCKFLPSRQKITDGNSVSDDRLYEQTREPGDEL